jgi:hypothetical protein
VDAKSGLIFTRLLSGLNKAAFPGYNLRRDELALRFRARSKGPPVVLSRMPPATAHNKHVLIAAGRFLEATGTALIALTDTQAPGLAVLDQLDDSLKLTCSPVSQRDTRPSCRENFHQPRSLRSAGDPWRSARQFAAAITETHRRMLPDRAR